MIINANALSIPLADKCVHTVVTSPPYYGLRDYGTAKWIGGNSECDHKPDIKPRDERPRNNLTGGLDYMKAKDPVYRDICGKCGAIRQDSQLGLEPTPDEYIANLVAVFRKCKRILRDDGTLWVNIGDSFAGSGCGTNDYRTEKSRSINKSDVMFSKRPPQQKELPGCKPKDLIGIPWMLAFALRADGWYLRSDIIWAKKNCMPESVKDRPTKSHEYIFLLSKSAKYYYDSEAIAEPSVRAGEYNNSSETHSEYAMHRVVKVGETRNKRDVWTIATKPYKGAHYATFNPELITPCILAGAPEGGIVFDPFVGSGTTVATAIQLGRRGVGIDLSFKYLNENAKARIDDVRLPLLEDAWK